MSILVTIIEILILLVLAAGMAALMFKTNHPHVRWGCLIGKHRYGYIGSKSGMTFNKENNQISGTMRRLYQCSCGKYKPIEDKDYKNS